VAAGTLLNDGADAPAAFPVRVWQHDWQAQFWPEVAPRPGELVLVAPSLSSFNTTDIERVLNNLGIKQLLIAGALTNRAVDLTAFDARDRGFEVIVAAEACVALTPELHASTLARLQLSLVPVLPVADITAHLQNGQQWPEQATGAAVQRYAGQVDDPWMELWPRPARPALDAKGTALITVDMQYLNAHREHGSGLEARRLGVTDFEALFTAIDALLPALTALQAAARRARLRLVHLRTACQAPDWRDSGPGRRPSRRPMAALGTRETEFLTGLEPQPGELVVNKTSWGPFNSTPLERWLRQL